ncbi:25759_t:CDS:1 [Gigaspora rosea]|nr:25759_t:CDS:1 [Gigaspora rosea]
MSEFIEGYLKDLLRGLRFTQTDLNGYITSAQSGLVDTSDEREVIEYLAREAQFRINVYYDFYILAGRILVKHQLNQIPSKFSEHIRLLYCNYREVAEGVREHVPVIDEKYHSLVRNNREFFDSLVDLNKEYDHGYME